MFIPTGSAHTPEEVFAQFIDVGERARHERLNQATRAHLASILCKHFIIADDEPDNHRSIFELTCFPYFFETEELFRISKAERDGESAVLIAGLLPERARSMGVSREYIIETGRGAFWIVAELYERVGGISDAEKYWRATKELATMCDVLLASRDIHRRPH